MQARPARQSPSPFRLTRRAFVLGAVGTFAAACGGTQAPAAQPSAPAASAQPKPGGTLAIRWWTGDPPDLDPYQIVTFRTQEFAGFFYSRLLKFNNGPGIGPNAFIPTPDLAESYQASQDGLTYTFKLRGNAKWQNKDPMKGRAVTADDVVWSFSQFQKVSPQKTSFNMVKDVKASDPHTVVFTLNGAFAPFETTIASPMFWILPKEVIEADGDARKRIVGSGPFIFDHFEKGVQVVAKRNPDYYLAGTPYVDEVDLLVVPQDATAVAALRAGQVDINGLSQTDRKAVAQTNPEIVMLDYPQNLISFLYWHVDAPPFNDVRVRQAFSLAIDRDEMIQTLYEGHGYINSAVPAGLESWYLDPRGADMGPNAKYFKRDVAAAKQLLAAAGHADGLKVPLISSLNAYGNTFNQGIELLIKQLKDAGIQADLQAQDYSAYIGSTFLGKYPAGSIVWGLETPFQEPHDYLYNMYHPKGVRNHASVNDPKLTQMIEQQMTTLDKTARKKIIFDIQRYLGEQQYYVIGPAGPTTVARQPWVKNFYYQSDYGRGAEYVPKIWLDGKKK
ncbi:MAG TPA: ABC transporter substrate-binding protein [Thermomicrobiales bacterium]|nr:ABC transporter substrate-binding protein [Thermomicrobiales bacterium]